MLYHAFLLQKCIKVSAITAGEDKVIIVIFFKK